MVNKPPKPAKAPKVNKRAARAAATATPFGNFAEGSLFARSEQFVKEHDAKPFRDFGYVVLAILTFFIWRLSVAVHAHHDAGIGIWSFFTFGTIVILNIWSYFLVMIRARRGGDIGIVKITDEDIIHFMWISGLFGCWGSIIYFGYRPRDPKFFSKAISASVLNVFWLAILVKFYL